MSLPTLWIWHKAQGLAAFRCPGCDIDHSIRISGDHPWSWNEDVHRPTLSPSVLVKGTLSLTDDQRARLMAGEAITPTPFVCHSFIRDGQIEFLGDCTHGLAGQTVPLPPCPHGDQKWER